MRLHPSLQSSDDAHSINFQPSPLMDALSKITKFLEAARRKIPFMRPAASSAEREFTGGSGRARILRKITRRISNSNFPRTSRRLQLPRRARERAIAGSNCSHTMCSFCVCGCALRIWPQVQKLQRSKGERARRI
jgi:hypothetical protein